MFFPWLVKITALSINYIVESYVKYVESVVSYSRIPEYSGQTSTVKSTDSLLNKLAMICDLGSLFKYCTDTQKQVLILGITGRVFEPQTQRIGFITVPSDGKTRRPTLEEGARYLKMSRDKYRREMSKARDNIFIALGEMKEKNRYNESYL